MNCTDLIPRTTLTEMVAAWKQCEADIRTAYKLLDDCTKRLQGTFKQDSYLFVLDRDCYRSSRYDKPDEAIKEIKKDVWRVLIDRMELRRVLSIKRAQELDKQLETGEGLPEIEETQILAMMEGTLNQVPLFIEECVREVFDWLMPRFSQWRKEYVTNLKFEEMGDRVIKGWCVEKKYSGRGFSVNHHRQKEIRALDNVFHALDGKGFTATYNGELADTIEASPDGIGETQYFQFKSFGNGNLHLKFKRMDLVARMNQIAGGMRLKDVPK